MQFDNLCIELRTEDLAGLFRKPEKQIDTDAEIWASATSPFAPRQRAICRVDRSNALLFRSPKVFH